MKLLPWIFERQRGRRREMVIELVIAEDDLELLDVDDELQIQITIDDLIAQREASRRNGQRRRPPKPKGTRGEPLENVYCEITYCSASGEQSQRPVTLLSLRQENGLIYVDALCHMRKALRCFRLDRMRELVTADGEIFSPITFFRDVLGVDLSAAGPAQPAKETSQGWISAPKPRPGLYPETPLGASRMVREALMSPLTVLVACARADGDFHIEELDRIMEYAEAEAMHLCDAGALDCDLTIEMAEALGKTIATMRPQTRTIERHMLAVLCASEAERTRFKRALVKVALADGIFHDNERALLEDFDHLANLSVTDPQTLVAQLNAAAAAAL